jgi:hypothetical protein
MTAERANIDTSPYVAPAEYGTTLAGEIPYSAGATYGLHRGPLQRVGRLQIKRKQPFRHRPA